MVLIKSWREDEYICAIKELNMGSFLKSYYCGYIGVPKDHPLFGLQYSDPRLSELNVHGGLTYSAPIEELQVDDYWFFGFDCAHSFDMEPNPSFPGEYVTNKNLDYVMSEMKILISYLRRWIQFC